MKGPRVALIKNFRWQQGSHSDPKSSHSVSKGGEQQRRSVSRGRIDGMAYSVSDAQADLALVLNVNPGIDFAKVTRVDVSLEKLGSVDRMAWQMLPNLRTLILNMNEITDMQGLRGNTSLYELSLKDNQIERMEGLSTLHHLTSLNMDVNRVKRIQGLQNCTALRELHLSNNAVTALEGLDGCTRLQRLSLFRNEITSIGRRPLSTLFHLQHLDLGRNHLARIEGLDGCPLLQCLILYENHITTLAPQDLPTPLLRELWLNGNRLSEVDMSGGPWLPLLEHLHLNDNAISVLKPLRSCPSLRTLDLSFNQLHNLSDLLSLAPCTALHSLQMNDNPLTGEEDVHRGALIAMLPRLAELDNQPVTGEERDFAISKLYVVEPRLRQAMPLEVRTCLEQWASRQEKDGQQTTPPPPPSPLRVTWLQMVDYYRSKYGGTKEAPAIRESALYETLCTLQNKERAHLMVTHKRMMAASVAATADQTTSVEWMARSDAYARETADMHMRHYTAHIHFSEVASSRTGIFISNTEDYGRSLAVTAAAAVWRSYWLNRVWQRLRRSAVVVQSMWRGKWHRRKWPSVRRDLLTIVATLKKHHTCTTIVQAVYRGWHTRKAYQRALAAGHYSDDDEFDYGGVDTDDFIGAIPASIDTDFALHVDDAVRPPSVRPCPSRQAGQPNQVQVAPTEQTPRLPPPSHRIPTPPSSSSRPEQQHPVVATHTIDQESHAEDSEEAADDVNAWGIKDPKVLAAMLKKKQRFQRMAKDRETRQKMADPAQRLEAFKRLSSTTTSHTSTTSHHHTTAPAAEPSHPSTTLPLRHQQQQQPHPLSFVEPSFASTAPLSSSSSSASSSAPSNKHYPPHKNPPFLSFIDPTLPHSYKHPSPQQPPPPHQHSHHNRTSPTSSFIEPLTPSPSPPVKQQKASSLGASSSSLLKETTPLVQGSPARMLSALRQSASALSVASNHDSDDDPLESDLLAVSVSSLDNGDHGPPLSHRLRTRSSDGLSMRPPGPLEFKSAAPNMKLVRSSMNMPHRPHPSNPDNSSRKASSASSSFSTHTSSSNQVHHHPPPSAHILLNNFVTTPSSSSSSSSVLTVIGPPKKSSPPPPPPTRTRPSSPALPLPPIVKRGSNSR